MPEQLSNPEEGLRLKYAMKHAIEHNQSKWSLLDWYSANRSQDGYLCNDLKTQHQVIVGQDEPEKLVDDKIQSKTVEIFGEISKIMQRFEDDTIHLHRRIQRVPYTPSGRGDKCIIYLEYYLLSHLHFRN